MKKLMTLLLALGLTASLAACGPMSTSNPSSTTSQLCVRVQR